MRRAILLLWVASLMVGFTIGVAWAHHGPRHTAVYRMESGPRWMPEKIVVKCAGWAEDSASVLRIVRFGDGRPPVYRCIVP